MFIIFDDLDLVYYIMIKFIIQAIIWNISTLFYKFKILFIFRIQKIKDVIIQLCIHIYIIKFYDTQYPFRFLDGEYHKVIMTVVCNFYNLSKGFYN